ncbi:protein eyes shut homolog [Gorilla gorilla gorilla]|uniref:protein eyes shut homolog n=1 Tax=Gorilla gorilla gorilla TaxID=9595 RepID=UPI0024456C58|nr:protein eyes shut homolog [Gorilla gorilla gorilla]
MEQQVSVSMVSSRENFEIGSVKTTVRLASGVFPEAGVTVRPRSPLVALSGHNRRLALLSSGHFSLCPLSNYLYFSCVRYYGDSYLEFQNVVLNPQNNISLEFQTFSSYGLLLYVKQDSNLVDGFFIQLFIENGTLKYHFYCPGEAKFKSINTTVRVDNGQKYTLLIRQELDPCKAELTILGRNTQTCESINHVLGKPLPKSGSVFIGGFPDLHGKIQAMTVPVTLLELNEQLLNRGLS